MAFASALTDALSAGSSTCVARASKRRRAARRAREASTPSSLTAHARSTTASAHSSPSSSPPSSMQREALFDRRARFGGLAPRRLDPRARRERRRRPSAGNVGQTQRSLGVLLRERDVVAERGDAGLRRASARIRARDFPGALRSPRLVAARRRPRLGDPIAAALVRADVARSPPSSAAPRRARARPPCRARAARLR